MVSTERGYRSLRVHFMPLKAGFRSAAHRSYESLHIVERPRMNLGERPGPAIHPARRNPFRPIPVFFELQ